MNILLWILALVLGLAFVAAGAMKLLQPRQKLLDSGMGWAEDFSPAAVKLIGLAEVLGGLGLVLPAALDVAPVLTPIAAAALAVTMLGAVVVHLRRGETQALLPPAVLLVLAVVLAWGRFGPYAF